MFTQRTSGIPLMLVHSSQSEDKPRSRMGVGTRFIPCINETREAVREAVWEAVRGTETTETASSHAFLVIASHGWGHALTAATDARFAPISAALKRWQAMRDARLGKDQPSPLLWTIGLGKTLR